jgi:hypothetical protein
VSGTSECEASSRCARRRVKARNEKLKRTTMSDSERRRDGLRGEFLRVELKGKVWSIKLVFIGEFYQLKYESTSETIRRNTESVRESVSNKTTRHVDEER